MKTELDHAGRNGEPRRAAIAIETVEDYELATQRVAALQQGGAHADGSQEREALLRAITRWDALHDDATRWKD